MDASGQDMTEVFMNVHNIMSGFPSSCTEADSIQRTAQLMKEYGVGAGPRCSGSR